MKLKAFTLAEILSVVTILGIVAAITIPSTMHNYDLAKSQGMIRKAATAYEQAINNMSVERGLYSDGAIQEYAGSANCKNLSNYFKQNKINADNSCYFQTPDGVYWYFGDSVTKPLISTLEIKPENLAQRIKEATDPNDEETYYLVGRFDSTGALRINDLQWEKSVNFQNNAFLLSKLYQFTRKIKNTSYYDSFLDEFPLFDKGAFSGACGMTKFRCTEITTGENGETITTVYDSAGRIFAKSLNGEEYSFNRAFSDKSGTAIEEGCSRNHENCNSCTGSESVCRDSRLGYNNCPRKDVDDGVDAAGNPKTKQVWAGYCIKQ